MCGIYGVSLSSKSRQNATELVFEGIKRIEYRGYDSWGVAVINPQAKLKVYKKTGKISGIKSVAELDLPRSFTAIGHTRWATHGGVTETNAHPHTASDGSFVLVQNGVMENYQALKAQLQKAGWPFETQTDTEVIVRLLENEKRQAKSDKVTTEIVRTTVNQLTGRSTVLLMTTEGELWAFRYGSPLVVGRDTQGSIYFSSDVLSLSHDATEYVAIDNGQLVSWHAGELKVIEGVTGTPVEVVFKPIEVTSVALDKEGYDHFMLKEIFEQAQVLPNVVEQDEEAMARFLTRLQAARTIYTIGAGSASYAAGQLAFHLREVGLPVIELKSYEARSYRTLWNKKDMVIALSQSGETADTNEVIEWMKAAGVTIASLVNMPGSTLSQLSDFAFMLQVGPEVGVASTKALTGQLMWSKSVALLVKGWSRKAISQEIMKYEAELLAWLNNKSQLTQLRTIARALGKKDHVFILGRGQLYYPALEFALKLKEISYIHAEGFSGGELKHGVIALIEKGTPVICLVAEDEEKSDMLSAAAEVKARGAFVIGVAPRTNQIFDQFIAVPDGQFAPISSIVPSQLLTYYMAVEKGLDPDKPRNLAKSVTVK